MATVSIIVPVFNVEQYIDRCLNSILKQSFPDYEIILVDDGSLDSCGRMCDTYAERYPFIRVIHQQNHGQAHARNTGVKASDAEWIMFVDSDDVIHPRILEGLYLAATQENADISACFRDETNVMPVTFEDPDFCCERFQTDEDGLCTLLRARDAYSSIYWVVYAKLIKKSIIESYPFTEGRIMEDNEVVCKWLTEAKTIAIIPEHLYYYRNNPSGTMNQPFSLQKLDYLWALEEQLSFFESRGLNKPQGPVSKEYVKTALWLASRVKNELGDEALARSVIRKAVRIHHKYAAIAGLTEDEERKLFKAAHPFLHRVKKKLHLQ